MLAFLLAKVAVLSWGQGWGPWVTHTCFLLTLKTTTTTTKPSYKINYWERNKATVASQVALVVKNPPANEIKEVGSIPGGGRCPGGGRGNPPTPVFLPGKSHGQRSPGGYSPEWNCSELAHVSEKSPRAPSSEQWLQLGSLPGVPYPLSLESVLFSHVRLFRYPMDSWSSPGFSRQEYWSGLPFPPWRDFPDPGIHPGVPHCKQIQWNLT